MIKTTFKKITEEAVFFISFTLAVVTSFFVEVNFASINLKVIGALFALMMLIIAFEKYNVLEFISVSILRSFHTPRKIGLAMIFTTSVLAMLVTNDVALITVVPLTILVARKANFNPVLIIILETLAANIGSSLTPIGNPQNLFLYEYYKIDNLAFFRITSIFVFIGTVALVVLNFRNNNKKLSFTVSDIQHSKSSKLFIYLTLFFLLLVAILRLISFWPIFLLVVVLVLMMDHKLVTKVDYYLLGTFVSFFIFVDNIARMNAVHLFLTSSLHGENQTLATAIIASQFISNVPAAILLSGFTDNYREILLGVNIGGLGTLIASLANLISFKFYAKEYGAKNFLIPFHVINFGLLLVISVIFIFLIG